MKFKKIILFLCMTIQSCYSNNFVQYKQTDIREKFSDILLIINFNHPYYANIGFLKSLYSCFDNIVFYGEKEDPSVITVPTYTGYLLSPVIYDVFTRHPNYKGYLFLQDDCALHFWNLVNLDPEKIWYAVKFNDGIIKYDKFFSIINTNGQLSSGYPWGKWNMDCCFNAAKAAYQLLPQNNLNMLQANVGVENIPAIMTEVFYVPARLKNELLKLNYIFKDVFCEVAVPTMLCCMEPIENWEQLTMLGGEGVGCGYSDTTIFDNYPISLDWVHPIKFSSPENRSRMFEIANSVGPIPKLAKNVFK